MKVTKTILITILLFGSYSLSVGQNIIKGANPLLTYKSGAMKDSQMKLKNGATLLVGFRKFFVEVQVSNVPTGQTIALVEENNEWKTMQVCEYDFEKDGKSEIVVAYGDGLTYLQVFVYKKIGNEYKEIGDFEGQEFCNLSAGEVILPYGSQGLFTSYKLTGGKFVQTN